MASTDLLLIRSFLLGLLSISGMVVSTAFAEVMPYSPEDLQSQDRISALFDAWNIKHGKHYPPQGSPEKTRRLQIFKENLHHIHRHNQNGSSLFTLGLTRFADLTNEEFKSLNYFGARPADSHEHASHRKLRNHGRRSSSCDTSSLLSTLDWREEGVVMSVKDQGSCGSCWAFSSAGAMESANAIATGNLISLSEQELVSCDTINFGCNGGWMDDAFTWVIENGGIDSEEDYPYTSSSGRAASCLTAKLSNTVVTISGYVDVEQYDESALQCAVALQPVSIALNGDAFDFQLYSGGIYDGSCSSSAYDIDHAILIVGWGISNGVKYWIGKNSWGTSWGAKGFINLVMAGTARGICGMYYQSSYPKSTSATPRPPPPPASPPPPYVPPPPSPPPPPPPPPSTEECDEWSSCELGETCCCIFELGPFCLLWGCCAYENAVCCDDHFHCCPEGYPICDTSKGYCYMESSKMHPLVGVPSKPVKVAKTIKDHQFPLSFGRNEFQVA